MKKIKLNNGMKALLPNQPLGPKDFRRIKKMIKLWNTGKEVPQEVLDYQNLILWERDLPKLLDAAETKYEMEKGMP